MGLEEYVAQLEQDLEKVKNSLATFYSSLAMVALLPPEELRGTLALLAGEAHNELRGLDRELS